VDEPEAQPVGENGKVKLMLHESHSHPMNNRYGNRKVEISRIYFSDVDGNIKNRFDTGEDIAVNVELKRNSDVDEIVFGYAVHSEGDVLVTGSNSRNHHIMLKNQSDTARFRLIISNVLLEGRYQFTAEIHSSDQIDQYDILDRQYEFMVDQETVDGNGLVKIPVAWDIPAESSLR
jgi:ABC-2 type transport system ATP-binding protein